MEKTHQQLKNIFRYLKELGIDHEGRKELVFAFTNGRSQSCADLMYGEARELENHLRSRKVSNLPGDKMRKKILSSFHEMGYTKDGQLDMDRIHDTIMKYGYLHKNINKYTVLELPLLVTQIDKMKISFLNSITK